MHTQLQRPSIQAKSLNGNILKYNYLNNLISAVFLWLKNNKDYLINYSIIIIIFH